MAQYICSTDNPGCLHTEEITQLNVSVAFESAASQPSSRITAQGLHDPSDAVAEMMIPSPGRVEAERRQSGHVMPMTTTSHGTRKLPVYWTTPRQPSIPEAAVQDARAAAQRQVRLEMTLGDAEELVEGLSTLIAAARKTADAHEASRPTALALAGVKVGDDRSAPRPNARSNLSPAYSVIPGKDKDTRRPSYAAVNAGIFGIIEPALSD
jgi:hypothetical protein